MTLSCRDCIDCYQEIQEIFHHQKKIAEIYKRLSSTRDHFAMSDEGIMNLSAANFNSYRSKIRQDIEKGFGLHALREIAINSAGKRPETCYGIRIDREKIKIII
jgi:CRISPR-associated protein Csx14